MTDKLEQVPTPPSIKEVSDTPLDNKGPEENMLEAEKEQGKPAWFKQDKYKTVEEQAKAYVELEKKFTEKSQKLAELEKLVNDTYRQLIADPDNIKLHQEYRMEMDELKQAKHIVINNYVKEFLAKGLAPEAFSDELAKFIDDIEQKVEVCKNDINQRYSAKAHSKEQLKQDYINSQKDKSFQKSEEEIQDDLKNPAIKLLYDKYKEIYSIPDDFVDFLPKIKEAFELYRADKDKISQINSQKNQIKSSSKGSGNDYKIDGKNTDRPSVADLLKDDGLLQQYLK